MIILFTIELFHYSQITKNTKPTTENFYILHEGLIGVVDKNLKEETYSTIEKEKKLVLVWWEIVGY